ncbi:MAG TPA: response regulator transcription factor, partial [Acidimicrobiia bacterium]|nr:response regulator transcription factor [Acidimicrobiia bacterium]
MKAVVTDAGPEHRPIEVMIVDDLRLFSEPLALAIDAQEDLRCTGTARDLDGLFARIDEHGCPDVILMDVQLDREDGVELTRTVLHRCPDARVLIVTGYATRDVIARAADSGAAGFLPKDTGLESMLGAIRSAWSPHGMLVDRAALVRLASESERDQRAASPAASHDPPAAAAVAERFGVTPREHEVLRLLALGRDPKRIARELGLSVHTARG